MNWSFMGFVPAAPSPTSLKRIGKVFGESFVDLFLGDDDDDVTLSFQVEVSPCQAKRKNDGNRDERIFHLRDPTLSMESMAVV